MDEDHPTPMLDYAPPSKTLAAARRDARFYAGMSFFTVFVLIGCGTAGLLQDDQCSGFAALGLFAIASLAALCTHRLVMRHYLRKGGGA